MEYCYETFLDFGVIGELPVEVFYEWHEGSTTNDSYEAPDPSGALLKDVYVNLNGVNICVTQRLNKNLIDDLEYECGEDYRGSI